MRSLAAAVATAAIVTLVTASPAGSANGRPPSSPGTVSIFDFDSNNPEVGVAWSRSTRSGSQPILRYVVRWEGGRQVVSARELNLTILVELEPGHYVFMVKAVSRAGSSPWTASREVTIR